MKRFHVHVSVQDLAASIRFYSTLFGAAPAVVKDDYAKWMLEDPRLNFAISQRGTRAGINHLGLQADSDAELESLSDRLRQADLATHAERATACCYARSNKVWVTDPTGIAWETFHTLGTVPTFGEEPKAPSGTTAGLPAAAACCAPAEAGTEAVPAATPVKAASACCA
jgi:catechol 2,3-dioxygenase-like lactoylglutathione lyase family enzyme